MEDKILTPLESDILLVLLKWDLVDPNDLVNSLLRKKAKKMLEQGKSKNFIIKRLAKDTKFSRYRINKVLIENRVHKRTNDPTILLQVITTS